MRKFYMRVRPDADASWAGMLWREGGGFTTDRKEAKVYTEDKAKNDKAVAKMLFLGLVRLIPVKGGA